MPIGYETRGYPCPRAELPSLRVDKAEASTRLEVERTLAQLVDSYRELGARTADFEVPD
jgi:hypothetical protein